jgi:hypothetical protein
MAFPDFMLLQFIRQFKGFKCLLTFVPNLFYNLRHCFDCGYIQNPPGVKRHLVKFAGLGQIPIH